MQATRLRPSRVLRMTAAAAALLIALLPAASGAQEVTLRLDPAQGDTLSYRFEQDMDFAMPPEFGGDQRMRSVLQLDQVATGFAGDTIRYDNIVREISFEMEGATGAENPDFSQFEGQTFEADVTRRNGILNLRMTDGSGVSEQVRDALSQMGFPLLPRGPVRPGESWTDTTRVDAAAMAVPAEGDIVSINRTTLQGLDREGGATVARLRVESTYAFEPGPRTLPSMGVELTGTRADDVRFDVTSGRFLTANGEQQFVFDITMPGASGSFTIEGRIRSRARLEP